MVRTFMADARYALRVLYRVPSFAISVIAVLSLGIGANTAIFSIVNTVLLRPLSYDNSDRLVRIFHTPPQSTFPGIMRFSVSPANFYDWQHAARTFEGMAIYGYRQFNLTGGSKAESIMAGAVGAGFFDVVRTPPALGRVFLADEDSPAKSHVVVISDGFWKTHMGSAPDAVGRTLRLNDEAYTIVGVMPARFTSPSWGIASLDMWVPIALHRHGTGGARQSQRFGDCAAASRRRACSRRSRRWI